MHQPVEQVTTGKIKALTLRGMRMPLVHFFYQGVGGIRDIGVIGVQTCAFFFSSRRRHTRYWRDWSSDVCSSDLRHPAACRAKARMLTPRRELRAALLASPDLRHPVTVCADLIASLNSR